MKLNNLQLYCLILLIIMFLQYNGVFSYIYLKFYNSFNKINESELFDPLNNSECLAKENDKMVESVNEYNDQYNDQSVANPYVDDPRFIIKINNKEEENSQNRETVLF